MPAPLIEWMGARTPPLPATNATDSRLCLVLFPSRRRVGWSLSPQLRPELLRKLAPGYFFLPYPRRSQRFKTLCIPPPNPSNARNGWFSSMATTWYGSAGFHHRRDKRDPEQRVSGMKVDGTPGYISHPPAKQDCHVCPGRLDPTSGVLHRPCPRACAKVNSAASKCEVLFSAAVGDRAVILANLAPLWFPWHCKVRPKYTDGKSTHPYCSRTCARASKSNGDGNPKSSGRIRNRVTQCRDLPLFNSGLPVGRIHGFESDPGKYCGKTHKACIRNYNSHPDPNH